LQHLSLYQLHHEHERHPLSNGSSPVVYIVDDERVIADTLATILQGSGFKAKSFNNPLDALSAATDNPPDLLISDVVMPQLSGIELAIQLKALCPECKILLFSGQSQTANLLRSARQLGHDFHLLTKPIHPKDLLLQIQKQDSRWTANELDSVR
jgi:CheY-like chemotaxis protein